MNSGDPFRLDGKVALVTGAGRGIGAAIAVALARAGADVALVARTGADLDGIAAEVRSHARRTVEVVTDLRTESDLHGVVDGVAHELGSLDLLVNNAGGATPGAFAEVSTAQLDDAFHFNVSVPVELVKAAVPHLLRGDGSTVVNVSSNLGHVAARGYLVYGTVKAALSHLTRLLAADLAPRIRVNAVAPSVVDTAGVASALTGEMRQQIANATPIGRLARPEEVASTVVWLASPASSYVMGEVIDLDGGAEAITFPRQIPDLT
jgi:7-alpha-hydroxysteroid dehydrogenase